MFWVRGFSVVSWSFVLLEFLIDFLRIQIAVQIAVHHHGRGMIAASEADDRQQRKTIVGRGLAQPDSQTLAGDVAAYGRSP